MTSITVFQMVLLEPIGFHSRREDPYSERVGGEVTALGNWAGFYCSAQCPERGGGGERVGGEVSVACQGPERSS